MRGLVPDDENTEPLLRLNVEAADEATVDAALKELGARLGTRVAH